MPKKETTGQSHWWIHMEKFSKKKKKKKKKNEKKKIKLSSPVNKSFTVIK